MRLPAPLLCAPGRSLACSLHAQLLTLSGSGALNPLVMSKIYALACTAPSLHSLDTLLAYTLLAFLLLFFAPVPTSCTFLGASTPQVYVEDPFADPSRYCWVSLYNSQVRCMSLVNGLWAV